MVTKPLVMKIGLSHNKANNTFLNSLRNNNLEAQVVFTFKKVMERARVTVIDVTVKKDTFRKFMHLNVLEFWRVVVVV